MTDSIAISHSIIVAFSGGAKQQGRTANGPFGLQVKQPPKGDEMFRKAATQSTMFNVHYRMWRHVGKRKKLILLQ